MLKLRWKQLIVRQEAAPADLDDDELVRRAQDDPEQFSELYRRYAPEIERFVRSRVSDPMLAEDITSKIFTKALQALPRYTGGSFRGWLYRITRNTIIDEYRRQRPTSSIDDLSIRDSSPLPDDLAVASDAADRLHAALDHLKPQHREIVRLRLHGLSIAEIADRMQMSDDAVKSAQRRAFMTLRNLPGVARMDVPTPMNSKARDDRFNRGLERLLDGDPAGIDEIEPELQDVAIRMVQLANDAGWIDAEPGVGPTRSRHWWQSTHQLINAVAAVLAVGLIAVMVTVGVRLWDDSGGQFGSSPTAVPAVELGPGVCDRPPRTDAEIAAIVGKSEDEVAPFQSDGVTENGTTSAVQLTRDWNTCLLANDWHRAMAYESEYFIWYIGLELFPEGVTGLSDEEIASRIADRHALIAPLETVDGMNLAIYTADLFRYIDGSNPPLIRGVDVWLVPVTFEGDWVEWPTVMSVEWDGEQWVIVSATRDGVPESPYFRDDSLPEATPES